MENTTPLYNTYGDLYDAPQIVYSIDGNSEEIKEIITNEPNPIQAKTKLIDKIKSFGSDVTSNIIANIITNPAIWGNF